MAIETAPGVAEFKEAGQNKTIETVLAPTPEDVERALKAGADVCVAFGYETRMVEDKDFGKIYAQHSNPIKKAFVAAKPEVFKKLFEAGLFGPGWEVSEKIYAPFPCFISKDTATRSEVNKILKQVFPEMKLSDADDFVWKQKNK
jgi:hypothetical protein